MNVIYLMGYLGQDPETKPVGDTTVTNFSLATSERWTDKNGDKQSITTWHRCVSWGKQGEIIAKYFSKGDPILVTGSIQKRDYDDKEGVKRQAVDVKVSSFQFIPSKNTNANVETKTEVSRPDVPNMAPSFDSAEEMPF